MTSAPSGAYLLQDVDSLSESIRSGDWAGTAMNLLSTGLDTAAAIMDPIGTLIANGLGWLIDHLQPLKGWFDDLTGHADEVRAFATTWKGVAADLHAAGGCYQSSLAGFDPITGVAASTYKELGVDIVKHVHSAGNWSGAIATGLDIAATLVQTVHDLVRDLLSQIVGSILAAVGEALATVGVGLAEIIPALITRISELAVRIGKDVTTVIETVKTLTSKIDHLAPEIERIGRELAEALRGRGGAEEVTSGTVSAAGVIALAGKSAKRIPTREEAKLLSRAEREELRGVDLGDGRDTFGQYTGADTISRNKEAEGISTYADQTGREVHTHQVHAKLDGDETGQVRKYDGLAQKEDGTYEGVEVKSGGAGDAYDRDSSVQRAFDDRVSPETPARAMLNGVPITITSIAVIRVP